MSNSRRFSFVRPIQHDCVHLRRGASWVGTLPKETTLPL